MSPTDCYPCCSSTAVPVNVPGVAGSNGVNAYTTTTLAFTIPAADGVTQVTIQVANSQWIGIGQFLSIPGLLAGDVNVFQVVSKPNTTSVTVVYPAYVTNINAGDSIPLGYSVTAAGSGVALTIPVSVANGGTGGTTKALGRTGLGVGQTPQFYNIEGVGYSITNALTTIPGFTMTATYAGLYLLLARVVVDDQGVTFAANRNLTIKLKNTTSGADLGTTVRNTGTPTTAQFISVDYTLPFNALTLAAGDVVALQIGYNTVPSAGTSVVSAAGFMLLPIALT